MFCPLIITRAIQFSALLGDLTHRSDVHLHFRDFGPAFVPFFSAHNQSAWLLVHAHWAVCDPAWSAHTTSTVFEHLYTSNLTFRLDYLASLPVLNVPVLGFNW